MRSGVKERVPVSLAGSLDELSVGGKRREIAFLFRKGWWEIAALLEIGTPAKSLQGIKVGESVVEEDDVGDATRRCEAMVKARGSTRDEKKAS